MCTFLICTFILNHIKFPFKTDDESRIHEMSREFSILHSTSKKDRTYFAEKKDLPRYVDGIEEIFMEIPFKSTNDFKYLKKHVELYNNKEDSISEGQIIKICKSKKKNQETDFHIKFGNDVLHICNKFNSNYRIFSIQKRNCINVINEIITYLTINSWDISTMIQSGNQYYRVKYLYIL